MKVTHKEELYIKKDNLSDYLFDEASIFFDIETTGFSPSHSSIYMIGCARKSGKHMLVDQFFAEKPEKEKENAFWAACARYSALKWAPLHRNRVPGITLAEL